jgi:hypothetical protein
MNSGFLFEEPDNYSLPEHAEKVRQSLMADDWGTVESEISAMQEVVEKKIFPYIQFSVEKDEMQDLNLNISRIKGCIDAKDKNLALVYVQELLNNWYHLNN